MAPHRFIDSTFYPAQNTGWIVEKVCRLPEKKPRNNGYRESDLYPRIVLHTLEAAPRSDKAFRSMIQRHKNPYHIWCAFSDETGAKYRKSGKWNRFRTGEKHSEGFDSVIQRRSLKTPAWSLLHPKGTEETNHVNLCIQISVAGWAADVINWTDDTYMKLASVCANVVRWLRLNGYPEFEFLLSLDKGRGGVAYGEDGAARMDVDSWLRGTTWTVCGHQQVPFNSHWDPGEIDYKKLKKMVDTMLGDKTAKSENEFQGLLAQYEAFQQLVVANRKAERKLSENFVRKLRAKAKNTP